LDGCGNRRGRRHIEGLRCVRLGRQLDRASRHMVLRVNLVHRLKIETESQMEMIDVTSGVRRTVKEAGVMRGMCHLFVPHTTAAITINENTDPNVRKT
jgi:hypothetical protein